MVGKIFSCVSHFSTPVIFVLIVLYCIDDNDDDGIDHDDDDDDDIDDDNNDKIDYGKSTIKILRYYTIYLLTLAPI
jgi:hypothetical protein